jgi:hypothetical protein
LLGDTPSWREVSEWCYYEEVFALKVLRPASHLDPGRYINLMRKSHYGGFISDSLSLFGKVLLNYLSERELWLWVWTRMRCGSIEAVRVIDLKESTKPTSFIECLAVYRAGDFVERAIFMALRVSLSSLWPVFIPSVHPLQMVTHAARGAQDLRQSLA